MCVMSIVPTISEYVVSATNVQMTTRDGSTIAMVTGSELRRVTGGNTEGVGELTYCVRVVRFVSGQTLDSIGREHVTPRLLFEVGQYLGRIDTALNVSPY